MTMPNPVAEVVERLRDVGCDRMPFTDDHAKCVCRLTNKAADLLERLSRERDTGVPFTTKEWEWIASGLGNFVEYVMPDGEETEVRALLKKVGALSAAPQPPTVSEGASSDLPDEIYVERDAETNEKRWFSCKGMGEKYVHARLLDNWKFVAKHGLAKVTPEHTWAQWLAEMKADLYQAREALAPFAAIAEHDIANSESDDDLFRPLTNNRAPHLRVGHLRRARSVLHPEKEDNS